MYGDDGTHITGQITFSQIAEAIRHKKYGRDMREAIAQGFEQFIGILQRVSNLESEYSDLQRKYNDIIGRLDDDEREIRGLQDKNIALNQRCYKIEETHREDIKELTALVDKLNKAVFGLAPAEINTPPVPDYSNKQLEEINFDDRKDKTNKW
ncbi:hypothetical protein EFR91_03095 [Lactobacillus amylovorus]|uniref:hypothetical protein n=1 Tax=Lactobacillus amylovorus TaxID=1604 RepID=UPI0021A35972|nr:hypothetical protein [Lactobacillus amylovorus]MCT3595635.1 hypothetical protein [Lactobacillus amylovorus]